MSDITRKTHYVPQATLRRWSENGSHVYAYDILVPHANVPDWQRRERDRGLPVIRKYSIRLEFSAISVCNDDPT